MIDACCPDTAYSTAQCTLTPDPETIEERGIAGPMLWPDRFPLPAYPSNPTRFWGVVATKGWIASGKGGFLVPIEFSNRISKLCSSQILPNAIQPATTNAVQSSHLRLSDFAFPGFGTSFAFTRCLHQNESLPDGLQMHPLMTMLRRVQGI